MSNARWVALSQGGRIVIQLGSLVILARLLPAADYGLMAMATVVSNFALLLRDLGTAAAIVQKDDLREETISTVFWLNVIMGWLIALGLVSCSPLIAAYFAAGELVSVLIALAAVFPLASAAAAHQALLERRSGFRVLARIEIISSGLGLLAAIVAALAGAGVYSFVILAVVTAALSCIQLWLASGWRPLARVEWSEVRGLMGFSGNLTLFNFINYFSRNADGMIIGRFLGAAALGSYSMAYKLMLFPVQNLTWVATRALYPVMSRQQNAPEAMARLYLRTIRLIALVTAPLMAGLVVVREPFVQLAFGPDWPLVPEILAWMAPSGFVQSIVSSTGTVFMARGRTDIMVGLGIFNAAISVAAFAVGAQFGVVGVAIFYCAANFINAIPCMIFTMRTLETSSWLLLREIWVPVVSALAMAAAVVALQSVFPAVFSPGLLGLFMSVFAGGLFYCLIVIFVFRQDLTDIRALMRPVG